jgi:hypothetical protein
MTAGVDAYFTSDAEHRVIVPDTGFVKCLYAFSLRYNGGLNMLPNTYIPTSDVDKRLVVRRLNFNVTLIGRFDTFRSALPVRIHRVKRNRLMLSFCMLLVDKRNSRYTR